MVVAIGMVPKFMENYVQLLPFWGELCVASYYHANFLTWLLKINL